MFRNILESVLRDRVEHLLDLSAGGQELGQNSLHSDLGGLGARTANSCDKELVCLVMYNSLNGKVCEVRREFLLSRERTGVLLELRAQLAEERGVPPGGNVLLLHHLLRGPHGLQVSGDGALQLGAGLVQSPQTGLEVRVVSISGDLICKIFPTWKIVVLSVGASAAAFTSFFFLNLLK